MTETYQQQLLQQLNDLTAYATTNSLHATTNLMRDLTDVGPFNWFNLLGFTVINGDDYKQTVKKFMAKTSHDSEAYQTSYTVLKRLNRHFDPKYEYLLTGHENRIDLMESQNPVTLDLLKQRADEIYYAINHQADLADDEAILTRAGGKLHQKPNRVPFKILQQMQHPHLLNMETVGEAYVNEQNTFTCLITARLLDEYKEKYARIYDDHEQRNALVDQTSIIQVENKDLDRLFHLQRLSHNRQQYFVNEADHTMIKSDNLTLCQHIIRLNNLVHELHKDN